MVIIGRIERARQIKEMSKYKNKIEKADTETLNEEINELKPRKFVDYFDQERMGKFCYAKYVLDKRLG